MIVTIHQPEHLPWLGFVDKIAQADAWVMLDHVQFRRNYYQNRNRIRGDRGPLWLTVPVFTKGASTQPINQVRIDNTSNPRWRAKCWATIVQHYQKASYWSAYQGFFDSLYRTGWDCLVSLNEEIIRYLLASLSINVKVIKSSDMKVGGTESDLLLNICRELGADVYLSGISGKTYLDAGTFARCGIEVRFQEFHHPIYKQLYEPFTPLMSTMDLLFNYGPASLDVLKGIGVETMDQVFE